MNDIILQAQNLRRSYGDLEAVKGINIEIQRGEVFGLLGPNGAGKTTTISMLIGLLESTSGQVLLDGEPLSPRSQALKSRIGYVPQEIALYPTLSAIDNLLFFGRIYHLWGKHLRTRVEEVLEIVGLTDRAKDPIDTYSGGMQRRINIAAGLIHQPDILFLDEPTVGVDPQSRNAIFESVEALNAAGLTLLYTTHYMEEAQRLCDRIAIMDHGQIIALDTPQALINGLGGSLMRVGLYNGKLNTVYNVLQGHPLMPEVSIVDDKLTIKTSDTHNALKQVLETTHTLDAVVTSLEILEPNLETVFLQLTGKSLRN